MRVRVPAASLNSHLPLQRLIAVRRARAYLADVERDAIAQARRPFYEDDFARSAATHSWAEIARALGVTRQAAWRRFRHLDRKNEIPAETLREKEEELFT